MLKKKGGGYTNRTVNKEFMSCGNQEQSIREQSERSAEKVEKVDVPAIILMKAQKRGFRKPNRFSNLIRINLSSTFLTQSRAIEYIEVYQNERLREVN